MYEGGLFMQVDVSHRVLRTQTVRNRLAELAKKGGDLKTEAEKELLGINFLPKISHNCFNRLFFQAPAS